MIPCITIPGPIPTHFSTASSGLVDREVGSTEEGHDSRRVSEVDIRHPPSVWGLRSTPTTTNGTYRPHRGFTGQVTSRQELRIVRWRLVDGGWTQPSTGPHPFTGRTSHERETRPTLSPHVRLPLFPPPSPHRGETPRL